MGNLMQMSHSTNHAVLEALWQRGVTAEHYHEILRDSFLADDIADTLLVGRPLPDSVRMARTLLSRRRFFGPADWAHYFGVKFRGDIPPFPWPFETLVEDDQFEQERSLAGSHFAYLGLEPINGDSATVRWWQSRQLKGTLVIELEVDDDYTCRTSVIEARWHLLRVSPPPFGLKVVDFSVQAEGLGADYKPAGLIEVVTMLALLRTSGSHLPSWGTVNIPTLIRLIDRVSLDGAHIRAGDHLSISCVERRDPAILISSYPNRLGNAGSQPLGVIASRKLPATLPTP